MQIKTNTKQTQASDLKKDKTEKASATTSKRANLIKKVLELVPPDLLLQGLVALCSSPEAYHLVRSTFGRSLAVFNMAAYILGIGDRHLDNVIVDLRGEPACLLAASLFSCYLPLAAPLCLTPTHPSGQLTHK